MLLKVLVGKVAGSGFYGSWSYDNKHRQEAEAMGIFQSIWPCNNGPLPWRISGAQRKILDCFDIHVKNISYLLYSYRVRIYIRQKIPIY